MEPHHETGFPTTLSRWLREIALSIPEAARITVAELGRFCKLKSARKHRHLSPIKRAVRLAEEPLNGFRSLNKAGVLRHIDHHRAYMLATKTTSLEFADTA